MSATVDTNLLLAASDSSSRFHQPALTLLAELAYGPEALYLFWPVVVGYVRIASDAGVFERPLSPETAVANVDALLGCRSVVAVEHQDGFWDAFPSAARELYVLNDFVAHGYLVALMREHRVSTIWSHDRHFRQFEGIKVRDPFVSLTEARPGSRTSS